MRTGMAVKVSPFPRVADRRGGGRDRHGARRAPRICRRGRNALPINGVGRLERPCRTDLPGTAVVAWDNDRRATRAEGIQALLDEEPWTERKRTSYEPTPLESVAPYDRLTEAARREPEARVSAQRLNASRSSISRLVTPSCRRIDEAHRRGTDCERTPHCEERGSGRARRGLRSHRGVTCRTRGPAEGSTRRPWSRPAPESLTFRAASGAGAWRRGDLGVAAVWCDEDRA
jgi:hypothetical protein